MAPFFTLTLPTWICARPPHQRGAPHPLGGPAGVGIRPRRRKRGFIARLATLCCAWTKARASLQAISQENRRFLHALEQWWRWQLGVWHLVDQRTMLVIAAAWCDMGGRKGKCCPGIYCAGCQCNGGGGGRAGRTSLANAYYRMSLQVICCFAAVGLVRRGIRIGRTDLAAAALWPTGHRADCGPGGTAQWYAAVVHARGCGAADRRSDSPLHPLHLLHLPCDRPHLALRLASLPALRADPERGQLFGLLLRFHTALVLDLVCTVAESVSSAIRS